MLMLEKTKEQIENDVVKLYRLREDITKLKEIEKTITAYIKKHMLNSNLHKIEKDKIEAQLIESANIEIDEQRLFCSVMFAGKIIYYLLKLFKIDSFLNLVSAKKSDTKKYLSEKELQKVILIQDNTFSLKLKKNK